MKKAVVFCLILLCTLTGCSTASEEVTTTEVIHYVDSIESLEATPITVADSFAGGDGTQDNPFQIETAEQLARMAYVVNEDLIVEENEEFLLYINAAYVLTGDIELNDTSDIENWDTQAPEYSWISIGDGGKNFNGSFDGQGYTISGMYMYSIFNSNASNQGYDNSCVGLFGSISGATLKNFNLVESYIYVSGYIQEVGGVVSNSGSGCSLTNCVVDVDIKAQNAMYLGGVGGFCNGVEFSNISYTGEITVGDNAANLTSVGSMFGTFLGQELSQCTTEGKLYINSGATCPSIGGLSGYLDSSGEVLVDSCVNNAEIYVADELNAPTVGGMFATVSVSLEFVYDFDDEDEDDSTLSFADTNVTIINCTNNVDVIATNSEYAGGLIGHIFNSDYRQDLTLTVDSCENHGAVESNGYLGGVVGYVNAWYVDTHITNCTNYGAITGSTYVGGVIGYMSSTAESIKVSYCTNEGEVYAQGGNGGILGGYISFNLLASENRKPITISYCENNATITGAAGILGTGGIVGLTNLDTPDESITFEYCVNNGDIIALTTSSVGGIIGNMNTVTAGDGGYTNILNCVNTGDILHQDASVCVNSSYDSLDITETDTSSEEKSVEMIGGNSFGGIAGKLKRGYIENCVNLGDIYIDSTATVYGAGAICGTFIELDDDDPALIGIYNSYYLNTYTTIVGLSFETDTQWAEDNNIVAVSQDQAQIYANSIIEKLNG